jgi:hypothetical protein
LDRIGIPLLKQSDEETYDEKNDEEETMTILGFIGKRQSS